MSSSPAIARSSVDLPQADEHHELAVLDLQVDVVQDLHLAEGLVDVLQADISHRVPPPPTTRRLLKLNPWSATFRTRM
jgi:hypothetical protein